MTYCASVMSPSKIRLLLMAMLVVAVGIAVPLAISHSRSSQPRHTVTVGTGAAYEFFAPASDLQCELSHSAPLGTYAYCQSVATRRSVKMTANGNWKECRGDICLGNPGLGTSTLRVSTRVLDGPITCDLSATSVSCFNRAGRGFVMTRSSTTSKVS